MSSETQPALSANSEAFSEYGELLLRYHQAKASGDDTAARQYRDDMEGPADELSPDEAAWLGALSGDLYTLHSGEVFLEMNRTPQQWQEDLKSASERDDGEAMLLLLRMGSSWPKDHIAYFRSRAYGMIGPKKLAALFMLVAINAAPDREEYQVLLLGLLSELGQKEAIQEIAPEILRQKNILPQLRLCAACILFRSTRGMHVREASGFIRQAAEALGAVLTARQKPSSLSESEAVMAWLFLGGCESALGHTQRSVECFDLIRLSG